VLAGVPDISGARLLVVPAVIAKAGSEAVAAPSVTLILIPDHVPLEVDAPERVPE
jgi:hypothetical protein